MIGLQLLGRAEDPTTLQTPSVPNLEQGSLTGFSSETLSSWVVSVLGIGTLILALMAAGFRRGELKLAYPAGAENRTVTATGSTSRLPLLEVLLLFVVGGQLVGAASFLMAQKASIFWPLWLSLCLLAVPFWPLRRGLDRGTLRFALGWYRGTGLLRELGWGILAYWASLPVLALGLGVSVWLSTWSASPPHHPVSDWMTSGDGGQMVATFVLATLWAPWLEETVFRGAFYHYLRGRLGIVGSALVSALVFAALHPQGLAGLPFLMTLALVLALVREWRASIVACMTMHFIHNSITLLLITVFIA